MEEDYSLTVSREPRADPAFYAACQRADSETGGRMATRPQRTQWNTSVSTAAIGSSEGCQSDGLTSSLVGRRVIGVRQVWQVTCGSFGKAFLSPVGCQAAIRVSASFASQCWGGRFGAELPVCEKAIYK